MLQTSRTSEKEVEERKRWMRDQGRVLNHGHRSRVGRRGGGVWWVLQQEEGLSNNRPRGTWKGVDQYFSCYLLTIIWPAAPNTQT